MGRRGNSFVVELPCCSICICIIVTIVLYKVEYRQPHAAVVLDRR